MREAELSPTCEYPLSRLPPVFLNRCGWVSYRFGVGFLSDTYPVVSDVSIVYPDVSQMYLIFLLVLSEEDTCILSSITSKCMLYSYMYLLVTDTFVIHVMKHVS